VLFELRSKHHGLARVLSRDPLLHIVKQIADSNPPARPACVAAKPGEQVAREKPMPITATNDGRPVRSGGGEDRPPPAFRQRMQGAHRELTKRLRSIDRITHQTRGSAAVEDDRQSLSANRIQAL